MYKYFENKQCKFYPCHKIEKINCLFCYCPLYLFKDCQGNFNFTKQGIKDCSMCIFPHQILNYDKLNDKLKKLTNNFKFLI